MGNFRKRLLTDLSIALIILVAFLGGIVFFRASIKKTTEKIVNLRKALVEKTSAIGSLVNLRQQSVAAQGYLNFLYSIVPTKDQLIDLPRDFQSLASQEKLGLGFSFGGENAPAPPNLGSVSFKLSIRGSSFDQLFRFIQRLQNFKYLSSIDNLSIRKLDSELEMEITGRVFFR
jgi:Tfp pilus assembly protein PilO